MSNCAWQMAERIVSIYVLEQRFQNFFVTRFGTITFDKTNSKVFSNSLVKFVVMGGMNECSDKNMKVVHIESHCFLFFIATNSIHLSHWGDQTSRLKNPVLEHFKPHPSHCDFKQSFFRFRTFHQLYCFFSTEENMIKANKILK